MDYAGFDCKITVPLQSPIRHRDGELWATPCKRRRSLKRSLETAKVKGLSLGVGCGKSPQVGTCHP